MAASELGDDFGVNDLGLSTPERDAALVPRVSGPSSDAWLVALAHFGACFAWFLAPLVVWLWARASAPRAAPRALAVLLWSGLGTLCAMATCGLAIPLFLLVHIWAGVQELRGQAFEYPVATELARRLSAG
ncbi:MAG TPA: hypothetical protein PLR99_06270 [Polyangiaceae bacterium]|nr:hypothetical protein [Polyangiaceae bacterium]